MGNSKSLLIIPTYNEIDNLHRLLPHLLETYADLDILVVDDNSPDGTANYVKTVQKDDARVKLIDVKVKWGGNCLRLLFNLC